MSNSEGIDPGCVAPAVVAFASPNWAEAMKRLDAKTEATSEVSKAARTVLREIIVSPQLYSKN